MKLGLPKYEQKQLIALLDKIKENHCKKYHGSRFGWSCFSEFDNEPCPIEDEVYYETQDQECPRCLHCPVFIIRNVLEEE